MKFFVYILFSASLDPYYVGTTDHVVKRLEQHNSKHYPNAFTSKGIPWDLKLQIPCEYSSIAYQLEKFIKQMKSKKFIERLIENPEIAQSIISKL
jgi:putative endonuclease